MQINYNHQCLLQVMYEILSTSSKSSITNMATPRIFEVIFNKFNGYRICTWVISSATKYHDDDDNNSIQFFIINVPSQQLQGQLETQHSVDTGNKIKSNNNSITNIN
jgi:hypothetical protein